MSLEQKRRDPLRGSQEPVDEVPAVLANRPRAAGARKRVWEQQPENKVIAYRGIPSEVQVRIKQLADEQGITVGEVARFLLEHALTEYAAGQLHFPVVKPKRHGTVY